MATCFGKGHDQSLKPADSTAGAISILTVRGEKVSITDEHQLHESKWFVGFMGPPGAGKSSLCNTVVYDQYHISPRIFFEPSNDFETFTKGLWMLSRETKRMFPNDSDWEVLDMEGFQYKSEVCWKMAMVLSVLAEVIVFCNRNPRCDVLFEAAEVFKKGLDFCKQLSMSPITKQVFIQVDNRIYQNNDALGKAIEKVKNILKSPEIEVIAFCIPEIPNADLKKLPFEPAIVESVRTLSKRFRFDKNSQAAAAKVTHLGALLKAFNDNNFDECEGQSLKFLEMDCKRIYAEAEAVKHTEHNSLASKKMLTSLDTTFDQFMGQPNWSLDLHFEKSPYYIEKHKPYLKKWYPSEKRSIKMPDIYKGYYDKQKEALKSKLEADKTLKDANIAHFNALVEKAIQKAINDLQTYVSDLEKNHRPIYEDTYFKCWGSFIDKREAAECAKQKQILTTPDWSRFETHYYAEQKRIEAEWKEQIMKAKWKSPVKSTGTLKCKNGHNLRDDVYCSKCNNCIGQLFWVDGPRRVSMCISCNDIRKIGDSLICRSCKAAAYCTVRWTDYMP